MHARWGVPAETLPSSHPAWDIEADYLAGLCATLTYTVRPDRIIIGGGVMQPPMYDRVRRALTAKLAEEDDPLDDPTVAWPDDRATVTLGTLELIELDSNAEKDDAVVVFDPTRLTDGIEPSGDEILATRPLAYSVSVERRAGAAADTRTR